MANLKAVTVSPYCNSRWRNYEQEPSFNLLGCVPFQVFAHIRISKQGIVHRNSFIPVTGHDQFTAIADVGNAKNNPHLISLVGSHFEPRNCSWELLYNNNRSGGSYHNSWWPVSNRSRKHSCRSPGRLEKQPGMLEKYNEIIQDQLAQGRVEHAEGEPEGKEFFTPHKPEVWEMVESTKSSFCQSLPQGVITQWLPWDWATTAEQALECADKEPFSPSGFSRRSKAYLCASANKRERLRLNAVS